MDDDEVLRRGAATTPDAVVIFTLDGLVQWGNVAFAELIGYRLDELAGLDAHVFSDDEGQQQFDRHIEEMRSHHPGAQNEEVLVRRRNGDEVWCLASWWPVHDDQGSAVAYIHRFTEYTQRRHFLDRLRTSELQLQRAQRIARLGSWTWEVSGSGEVWWSDNLYAIYGVDRATFRPSWETFLGLLDVADRARVQDLVLTAIDAQDRYSYEMRRTLPDEVRWLRVVAEIERDDDGLAVRIEGTTQDITELKNAHATAARATANLVVMQQLAEAANRSTNLADALVRSAQILADQGDWHPVCVFVKAHRGAPLTTLELPQPAAPDLPRPDFEVAAEVWRTREVLATPLLDRTDDVLVTIPVTSGRSMACVIQAVGPSIAQLPERWPLVLQVADQLSRVAERERTAQQLTEARDEAMEASRHKSEFLATMSHEIRTPMNGVIGLTDLLLRSDLTPYQRRMADGLRGAGLTLLALINDILDLSKIESGKLELEAIEFDVRQVVDEMVLVLAGPAEDRGLEFVAGVAPDVPRLVLGDPVRLGQVLTNLGSNAVKFTERGEVVVDVSLEPDGSVGRQPDQPDQPDQVVLRVEVRDTGIGIAEDALVGLFDAFTQADRSTTRQHGGTGLGLAISRQLVEGMGGEIGVRSTPGSGSVFWFTVRVGALPVDADLSHLERPLRQRRALVVADHAATASFLTRQLAAWQVQVDHVESADAAMSSLAAAAYDVALVDLAPAGVAGLDLARRVRDRPRLAPTELVLVAGEGAVTDAELRAAGFRTRVAKPIRTSDLYLALLDGGDATDPVVERPAGTERTDLGLQVLVVEDNAVNQLVATGLLQNVGCTVTTVGNGLEAVEALEPGHGYDVVLMDCRMPRMDGFDATRAIRRQERDSRVPIIAMTASALPGERERCLEAGMDDFLTKPVDPAQLTASMTRAAMRLGRVSLQRHAAPERPATVPAGVLDLDRVEVLRELVKDGTTFFDRARASFLSRIDGAMAQLSIAVQDGDATRLRDDAHQLRGSALNLGLVRVGVAAEQLEDVADGGDLASARELLEALRDAVTEGVVALAAVGS